MPQTWPVLGPFTKINTTPLCLLNYSQSVVAYKIMTTQPQYYVVRPGFGLLKGRQKINIEVQLDPIRDPAVMKKKHKFMIQAAVAPTADVNLEEFWKNVDESETQVTKVKVVFEVQPGESLMPSAVVTPPTSKSKSRRGSRVADPDRVKSAMRKVRQRLRGCYLA